MSFGLVAAHTVYATRLTMAPKCTVFIAFALLCSACSKQSSERPQGGAGDWPKHGLTEAQAEEALATIGDRTITVGEFADRLASQSPYLRARFESPERRKEFLDNLVRYELLVYEAKRRGYADEPTVVRARRNAIIQQLVKKEIDEPLEDVEITEDEIRTVYESNPDDYMRPAQVRAAHIFIRERGRAQRILKKARNADLAAFRQLARETSEDEATRSKGGDLKFFEADSEPPPSDAVRAAAFSLDKVGQVHPTLVKDGDGYHIIMLTGKRAPLTRTYDQAKRAIRHRLIRERKEAAIAELTAELREDIDVKIDYEALKEVRVETEDSPRDK